MAGISVASSGTHKRAPKVLKEITLSRHINGDVIAMHRYHGYQHDEEPHNVEPTKEAVGAHVAKHMNLGEQEESEPEPNVKDREQL